MDNMHNALTFAPRTLREKELADTVDAVQQLAPLVLLLIFVLAAGVVGLVLLVLRRRRRHAEMRKVAGS